MTTLSLSSLSLHHFRNYEHARLDVSPAPVVLFGHNGAGKTNLLEAISLLVPGRGLRRARLHDLIHTRHHDWAVVAYAHGLQGEVMIGTGRDPEAMEQEKRLVKIDGKMTKSQAELAQHISVLWLTPQMEQLFLDGTSEGRKFLDRLVYSFDADHASHVNAYEQAMRERNRLLAMGNADSSWLSAIENTMAEKAASIASSRLMTVQHINHAVSESTLSFPKPHLSVRGLVEDCLDAGKSALEAENAFRETLLGGRNEDRAAGRTLSGVHRSELQVTHKERDMPAHLCSTGEQKALILSIILAQSRAGAEWKGVVPIILLDEVVAHLDPSRRVELFEEILDSRAQVFMTGTDSSLFDGIQHNAQCVEIRDAQVMPRELAIC